MASQVPINNAIEQALQPNITTPIDTNNVLIMELVDMLRDKTQVVRDYLSSQDMKTEITETQRRLLPLLQNMALEPYPSIIEFNKQKYKELNKRYDNGDKEYRKTHKRYTDNEINTIIHELQEELRIKFLEDFVSGFLKYGIAVKRKGRGEDLKAVQSLTQEALELIRATNGNNQNNKKLW